jgi:hypothetical protein
MLSVDVLSVDILSVVMLIVNILNVVKLSVVMLSVIILSVVAPRKVLYYFGHSGERQSCKGFTLANVAVSTLAFYKHS